MKHFLRPRISRREAKFVLESLKRDKAEVERKLERLRFLDAEIERIGEAARSVCWYDIVPENYGDMKKELESLKNEADNLRGYLQVYGCLIAKYEVLASGEKQRGRYKVDVDSAEIWLSILGY